MRYRGKTTATVPAFRFRECHIGQVVASVGFIVTNML